LSEKECNRSKAGRKKKLGRSMARDVEDTVLHKKKKLTRGENEKKPKSPLKPRQDCSHLFVYIGNVNVRSLALWSGTLLTASAKGKKGTGKTSVDVRSQRKKNKREETGKDRVKKPELPGKGLG